MNNERILFKSLNEEQKQFCIGVIEKNIDNKRGNSKCTQELKKYVEGALWNVYGISTNISPDSIKKILDYLVDFKGYIIQVDKNGKGYACSSSLHNHTQTDMLKFCENHRASSLKQAKSYEKICVKPLLKASVSMIPNAMQDAMKSMEKLNELIQTDPLLVLAEKIKIYPTEIEYKTVAVKKQLPENMKSEQIG